MAKCAGAIGVSGVLPHLDAAIVNAGLKAVDHSALAAAQAGRAQQPQPRFDLSTYVLDNASEKDARAVRESRGVLRPRHDPSAASSRHQPRLEVPMSA
jgi:hypothetical protein